MLAACHMPWLTSVAAVVVFVAGQAVPSAAQQKTRIAKDEVGWIYSRARFAKEFRELLAREGSYVAPAPLDLHPVPSDTLEPWIWALMATAASMRPESPWRGEAQTWRVIAPGERLKHQGKFNPARMAYVGNDHFTAVDTTVTPRIRAKLQSAFGAPTKTIVESRPVAASSEYIQFEYWIIVNDSIPVIVMDARGPFDHGVVLAGDFRFRDHLYSLRQSLLGRILLEAPYGVFTDYFYDEAASQWYRTGYDGIAFFTQPIRPPDLARGRPVANSTAQD